MSEEQDIRVGDIVCAKSKDTDGNDVELHGTVHRVINSDSEKIVIGNLAVYTESWSIEVTKRPYVFPTEPGLYLKEGQEVSDSTLAVYCLVEGGEWRLLSAYNPTIDSESIKRNLELHRVKLVPLVLGEVAS